MKRILCAHVYYLTEAKLGKSWIAHVLAAVVRKSHILQSKKQEGHSYCPGIIIRSTAISIFKYCDFFVFHYTDFQGLKNELSNSKFQAQRLTNPGGP